MSQDNTATADSTSQYNTSSSTAARAGHYANRPRQFAPLFERLKERRITYRKVALYTVVAAIVVLSTPIMATFIAGSVLVVTGLLLRTWTFGHLEKNQRMITTGPFAHSRNPAYLGSFLVASGFVLAAGDPFSASGLIVWGAGLILLFVFFYSYLPRKYAREYPRLEAAFPEEFKAHAANVPDFFPRPTPWRSGDTQRFSWSCVQANHEFWWAAILILGMALLWVI